MKKFLSVLLLGLLMGAVSYLLEDRIAQSAFAQDNTLDPGDWICAMSCNFTTYACTGSCDWDGYEDAAGNQCYVLFCHSGSGATCCD